jgi:putative membrane protein insertion efficiency factor
MKTFFVSLLRQYRKSVSPVLGHQCRFYPSCSQYAEEAFSSKGMWLGSLKTLGRILKCHPFHPGGFDPVD